MTFINVTQDLPHVFDKHDACLYCDADFDDLSPEERKHCEQRALFEARR